MGNHAVGRAFVAVAETVAARRLPGQAALQILDIAAEKTDIRGADAEFDDAPWKAGIFRDLLIEAFGNGDDFTVDEDGDRFSECYQRFSTHYGLC